MLRILLVVTIYFSGFFLANAQCTPDTAIGNARIYPAKIGDAMAGYTYYQTFTFRVTHDSDIVINGTTVHAVVDSAHLISIGGIPQGYSYACTPAKCTWPGGSLGCALLQGKTEKTDTAKVKEYPIMVIVQSWFKVGSLNLSRVDTNTEYIFKIKSYSGNFEISKTKNLTVHPNPSEGNFKIELRDIQTDNNRIEVYGLDGRLVFEKQFNKPTQFLTTEEVSLNPENKGIYLVRMVSGGQVYQQKIVVN